MGCGASVPLDATLPEPAQPGPAAAAPVPGDNLTTSPTLAQVSAAEGFAARHGKLITGGLKFASALVGATGLPGASALAGAMQKVSDLVSAANENLEICHKLYVLVLTCDTGLAALPDKAQLERNCLPQLQLLTEAMQQAAKLTERYGQGKVPRLLMAISGSGEFLEVKQSLLEAMTVGGWMEAAGGGSCDFGLPLASGLWGSSLPADMLRCPSAPNELASNS